MYKRSAAILTFSALAILYSCGGSASVEATFPPGTPSHAVQKFIKAIHEGDVKNYISSLDSKARAQCMQASGMPNFEQQMKGQLSSSSSQMKGVTIVGEKINGDAASVTLKCPDGELIPMECIKESSGWKIRLMK
jgi:hypothetical protein